MYPVSERFHELTAIGNVRTRCRIYFIDDEVDCTNDTDVMRNGVLLVRSDTDTDSGRRITNDGGIVFSDTFNNDPNLVVGCTASKIVQMSLLNVDDALTEFGFGKCKIFIDAYDPDNGDWLACPMGVYIIDTPARLNSRIVIASGYDQMQYFNEVADAWWNGIDWSSGKTALDLISDIASQVNVHVSHTISERLLNTSVSYTAAPLVANETTYRDILAYICGLTGTIAYFDRDGALDMRWFAPAVVDVGTVYYDADTNGGGVISVDVSDYAVTPIDMLQVLSADQRLNTSVGNGSNVYYMSNNPFITGADADAVNELVTPIFDRLSTVIAYRPMYVRLISDWAIESGDIINVVTGGMGVMLPIMQQTMTWRGTYVVAEMASSGDAKRPTMSEAERDSYAQAVTMHEFENTAAQLRSLIYDLNGNYTLINQTVNSIAQTVSGQGNLIQDILDPTGEIWTAIRANSSDLSDLEDALNDEVSERKSYIRFIPAEPAIVLGVDTDTEIKLKLVNNVIYFFNGDDDSTDLSLAYAYFNSEETGSDRFIAKESIQVGNDSSAARWVFRELTNGDLVLDMV